jgi:hypothetical protein
MMDLRDAVAPGEKVAWWVVVCGVEELEREAIPMMRVLEHSGANFGVKSMTKSAKLANGSSMNSNVTNGHGLSGINGVNNVHGVSSGQITAEFQQLQDPNLDDAQSTLKKSRSKFSKFFTREKTIRKSQSQKNLNGSQPLSRPQTSSRASPLLEQRPPLPTTYSLSSTNLTQHKQLTSLSIPPLPSGNASLASTAANNAYNGTHGTSHTSSSNAMSEGSSSSSRTSPTTKLPTDNLSGRSRSGTTSRENPYNSSSTVRQNRADSHGAHSGGSNSQDASPVLPTSSLLSGSGTRPSILNNGTSNSMLKLVPTHHQQNLAAATAAVIAASKPLPAIGSGTSSGRVLSYGHSRDSSQTESNGGGLGDLLSLGSAASNSTNARLPRLTIPMIQSHQASIVHSPIQSPMHSPGLFPGTGSSFHSSHSQPSSSPHSPSFMHSPAGHSPSGPSPTKSLPPLPPTTTIGGLGSLLGKEFPMRSPTWSTSGKGSDSPVDSGLLPGGMI